MDISGKWYLETVFPDLAIMLQVRAVHYSGKTSFQNVEVLESETFGRSLVLDGKTQSTEVDEFVYHEALVHPPMLLHPNPRTIFIGGFGSGEVPGFGNESGMTDLDVWAKWQIPGGSGRAPLLAVGGLLTLPIGSTDAGLSLDSASSKLFVAARFALPRGLSHTVRSQSTVA